MIERTRYIFRAPAGRDTVQQANSTLHGLVLGQVSVRLSIQPLFAKVLLFYE
jgi:hypothetical protein